VNPSGARGVNQPRARAYGAARVAREGDLISYTAGMTRDEVMECLVPVFRERGLEGATISEIAKAAGLGKASLYHHFPDGKDEMLQAVIARVLEQLERDVFLPLNGTDSPKRRLLAVIGGLADYAGGGERNCLLGILALGTARERMANQVGPRLQVWTSGIERLYVAAGLSNKRAARAARNLLIRFHGAIVVSRLEGGTEAFQFTVRRLVRELEKL
jgi:AcrR family transcriptional regulator